MTKLTALIEAADSAKADADYYNAEHLVKVKPETILELCELLKKAEDGLTIAKRQLNWAAYPEINEALAAIKQWKEQA